jgi:hypothetical protein
MSDFNLKKSNCPEYMKMTEEMVKKYTNNSRSLDNVNAALRKTIARGCHTTYIPCLSPEGYHPLK